ncbi:MAG TPA: DUF2252 domain-containing protein [Kofleriaceae bacterium]|nr:DUF2252 domain-containing protein [Kofleriaceae bacterium]
MRASPDERRARGKALREALPRSSLGAWAPSARDAIAILSRAVVGRDPSRVELRWSRMAESPLACFRGAITLFATDVMREPTAGVEVQLCGDAHLFNLGAYAAPDGHLVFDLNDFDHACRGPFEWDLRRLAASVVLAGREAGQREGACRDAVSSMVASYREAIDRYAEMRVLDVARTEISPRDRHRPLAPIFERAARDTPARLLRKATASSPEGTARFREDPPYLVPLPSLDLLGSSWSSYRDSLGAGRQQVLDAYTPVEIASRAQGIDSLGLASWIVLAFGNGDRDPLFLQLKEIGACAWGRERDVHGGRRAAEGQARTQTVSDPFLGWTSVDGVPCLVRQWSDHKGRCTVEMLGGRALGEYAALCGQVLAKAHARTGDAAILAGYVGSGDNVDRALASFAVAYADQATADHAALIAAIRAGTV